jgi:hypothetical protein
MSDAENLSAKDFAASFKSFLENMAAQPGEEPVFLDRLQEHFGRDPRGLAIVQEAFDSHDHPNVHLAVEAWIAGAGRSAELLGISAERQFGGVGLASLISPGAMMSSPPAVGPVEHRNVPIANGEVLSCVQRGLFLVRDGDNRLALLLEGAAEDYSRRRLRLEVMALDKARAERLLGEVRAAMRKRNVYRGHVVSLGMDDYRQISVSFHRLPAIQRDTIILPDGLLERIERQTVRFGELSSALRSQGRHLKRGLLLYGPPGTGKTMTAMHLAGRMRDRTVLLLTGRGLGLVEESCGMARLLQPATVILEDVDLVAEERTRNKTCGPILFELLNAMDGLAEDADVVFLLTTNRPDLLEPALAARPGRIDMAVEVPLPDATCRRRLFDLYAAGLPLADVPVDTFVARTAGVSAAFLRELLRKAALFAADEASPKVGEKHLSEALHELAIAGGHLTRSLLGATRIDQSA